MATSSFTVEQKKGLLWIIAALAILRFAGVPLLEYQAELKQSLELTTQQVERAKRLMDAEGSSEDLSRFRDQRTATEEEYIRFSSDGEFRLQAQQQIERVLRDHNIQVELFDWLTRESRADGYIRAHQAQLNIQGPIPEMLKAQLALAETMPGVRIREFTLTPQQRGARRTSQTNQGRVNMLVEVAGVAQQ